MTTVELADRVAGALSKDDAIRSAEVMDEGVEPVLVLVHVGQGFHPETFMILVQQMPTI
jgi:hypothetical protein